jgi:prepilin-type N-terminal cleavage/methylation domain-containing protein
MPRKSGYSLIELLIVITLVAFLAVTATNFLFTSLSGSGKASGLAVVKQNGDHTIGVIERRIRDAQAASCPSADSLLLTDAGGEDTTFAVTSDRVTSTTAAGDVFLTSERIVAESFSCSVISGAEGTPDIVAISFQLRLGDPSTDRPEEVAVEQFETRVTMRTY